MRMPSQEDQPGEIPIDAMVLPPSRRTSNDKYARPAVRSRNAGGERTVRNV
jgi:hypothetical protein